MNKRRGNGKLGCSFYLAVLLLYIIMTSSGVSAKAFFIAVGIAMVIIAVACVVQAKKMKK